MDTIAAVILLFFSVMFMLGITISIIIERWGTVSKLPAAAPSPPNDYGKHAGEPSAHKTDFRASRPEVEAEVEAKKQRKLSPEAPDGIVTLTQNALQSQLAEAETTGMIKVYAALSKGGYLVPGKATEIKRSIFGVAGGRGLQQLNARLSAVELPTAAEAPDRLTPVAQRPIMRTTRFAGEAQGEKDDYDNG